MRQWMLGIVLVGLGAVATLGCREVQSQDRAEAVAIIAGTPLTADEFRDRYVDYLLESGLMDEPVRRSGFLERMVSMRLLIAEQEAAGIANEPGYQQAAERLERKLLIDGYMETVVYDTLTSTQQELEAMFVRMNTQLEARHLYARTREQADALYARVQAGETFEALAREVFVDETLSANGGAVGTFGFDEMDPAFEDAAYALEVGAVSPPVRTALGYSIIRLDDRITKPLLTEYEFAEKKDRVEVFVQQRKRNDARRALTSSIYDGLDLQMNDAVAEQLVGIITGNAVMPSGEAANAWRSADLLSFDADGSRQTWTVDSFLDAARFAAEAQRAQVQDREDLEAFATGVIAQELLLDRARAANVQDLPAFTDAFAFAINEWVFEQAYGRVVAQAPVPEDSVSAYFERFADEFTVPQRLRVREIMTDSKAEADRLRTELATTDFAALATAHSIRPGADATGGDLGYVTQAQLGVLGSRVFAASEGDVVGPLEVGGRYALFEVGDRKAAEPATLDDARAEIEKRLRREYQQTFLQNHADALRERFEVVLHPEVLHAFPLRADAS